MIPHESALFSRGCKLTSLWGRPMSDHCEGFCTSGAVVCPLLVAPERRAGGYGMIQTWLIYGRWWLLSCTCILGREARRPALRHVAWPGKRRRVQRPGGHGWDSRAQHSVFVDQLDSLPGVDRRERITNSAEVDEGDGTIAQRANDRGSSVPLAAISRICASSVSSVAGAHLARPERLLAGDDATSPGVAS